MDCFILNIATTQLNGCNLSAQKINLCRRCIINTKLPISTRRLVISGINYFCWVWQPYTRANLVICLPAHTIAKVIGLPQMQLNYSKQDSMFIGNIRPFLRCGSAVMLERHFIVLFIIKESLLKWCFQNGRGQVAAPCHTDALVRFWKCHLIRVYLSLSRAPKCMFLNT